MNYVTPAQAAQLTETDESTWRYRILNGKARGALKRGKQWLIPLTTIWDYTPEADSADLNAALERAGVPTAEHEILDQVEEVRALLTAGLEGNDSSAGGQLVQVIDKLGDIAAMAQELHEQAVDRKVKEGFEPDDSVDDEVLEEAIPRLLESMREKMAEAERLYHHDKTNHYVADVHLLKLVIMLAEAHPQEETINEVVDLWRTVGKRY